MNASGWVHRDVKPDNILSTRSVKRSSSTSRSPTRPPKGLLAKMFRKRGKSQGTRSYMSPEQIRGEVSDGRADIYSFGATCYEVATAGRRSAARIRRTC